MTDQLPDGGFAAPWSEGLSSIDATCYRLDTGGLDPGARERALDFLAARRRPDGTWAEADDLGELLPPWLRSDVPDATAYLSWNAALMLARAGRLDEPPPVKPSGYPQTTWLAAATLLTLGRHEAAAPSLDRLESRIATLDGDDLAWLRRSLGAFAPLPDWPAVDAVLQET